MLRIVLKTKLTKKAMDGKGQIKKAAIKIAAFNQKDFF